MEPADEHAASPAYVDDAVVERLLSGVHDLRRASPSVKVLVGRCPEDVHKVARLVLKLLTSRTCAGALRSDEALDRRLLDHARESKLARTCSMKMLLVFLPSRRGSLEILEQIGRLAQKSLARCSPADSHQSVLSITRL
eukprot:9480324-Pyramimonas_sp.AAC.1